MTETETPTRENLLKLAADFDAGKDIDATPEPKQETPEAAAEVEPKSKPEPEHDGKAEEEKPKDSDKSKDGSDGGKDGKAKEAPKTEDKVKKSEDREGKTWQKINAEKEALKAEREALIRERDEARRQAEAIQRAKANSEPLRDEHGATARDYRETAKQYREKGETAMAEACEQLATNIDRKQKQLQEEHAKAQFAEAWKRTYEQVSRDKPDLTKQDSPLQKETVKILNEHQFLLTQEDGLKHAVRLAESNLVLSEFEGTKAELAKLKEDHAKLQKKLSINGGPPTGAPGEEAAFEDLPLKEQRKRLERAAREADRERGYSGD